MIIILTGRFWSRMIPVTLQIPISTFFSVALWWRGLAALYVEVGLTALPSQRASFSFIDVGRASSACLLNSAQGFQLTFTQVLFATLKLVLRWRSKLVTSRLTGVWNADALAEHSKQVLRNSALSFAHTLRVGTPLWQEHISKCDRCDQGGHQNEEHAVSLGSSNSACSLRRTFAHLFSDFPPTHRTFLNESGTFVMLKLVPN
eukprot:1158285-Pelagomonas_calceolata.AAC.5